MVFTIDTKQEVKTGGLFHLMTPQIYCIYLRLKVWNFFQHILLQLNSKQSFLSGNGKNISLMISFFNNIS